MPIIKTAILSAALATILLFTITATIIYRPAEMVFTRLASTRKKLQQIRP